MSYSLSRPALPMLRVHRASHCHNPSLLPPAAMSALKTFIIEDSPVILENLVATLEELDNLEVVGSVPDEAGAVQALRDDPQRADLLIVDIFLRQGSGLGVLIEAQKMALPARRVVLTNYATEDIRRRCMLLGAERVFDKSRELEDLISYCAELSGSGTRPAPLA
jgi:DNA-binding NarL/FixJ family response regulator